MLYFVFVKLNHINVIKFIHISNYNFVHFCFTLNNFNDFIIEIKNENYQSN